jgi:hypothetical protein
MLAAALLAAALIVAPAVPADNDQFSPATQVNVDPTLSVAPAFAVGRLCFPGSTCPSGPGGVAPAQEVAPGHSLVIFCLRPLIPEKLIDLPGLNFPGGAIPAETQVFGFYMDRDAQCPS